MNTQRLLIGLSVLNVALFACSLGQSRAVAASDVAPVLRGRALEIVDDRGRVRASITLLPAEPDVRMPDGTKGSPETVLLRLINAKGRPNVKIAATEKGSGQLLAGDADPVYVQILAEGPRPTVKLSNEDGQVKVLEP